MNLQNEKCVIVVDEELPLGIIANTAVILGITLGKTMPEAVGPDVIDQTEKSHLGIIKFPVPVLKSSAEKLKYIREQLYQDDFHDLLVVDFSDLAQSCKTYDDFIQKMIQVPESYKNNPHPLGKYMGIMMGVIVFIVAGFEHCVANMFYFSVANAWSLHTCLYLLIMTLGNLVGGVLPELAKKCWQK